MRGVHRETQLGMDALPGAGILQRHYGGLSDDVLYRTLVEYRHALSILTSSVGAPFARGSRPRVHTLLRDVAAWMQGAVAAIEAEVILRGRLPRDGTRISAPPGDEASLPCTAAPAGTARYGARAPA